MSHLTSEDRRLCLQIFAQVDKDGKGFLTKEEFREQAAAKLGFKFNTPLSQTIFEDMLNAMDKNQDGTVTVVEFLSFCESMDPEVKRLAEIRQSFLSLDLDRDIKFSEEGMLTSLRAAGLQVTKVDVQRVYQTLGMNRDHNMTFREFAQLF